MPNGLLAVIHVLEFVASTHVRLSEHQAQALLVPVAKQVPQLVKSEHLELFVGDCAGRLL